MARAASRTWAAAFAVGLAALVGTTAAVPARGVAAPAPLGLNDVHVLGLAGQPRLSAYLRRSTALRALDSDSDDSHVCTYFRDTDAIQAAERALATLSADAVTTTQLDGEPGGHMLRFERRFTSTASDAARDQGLLYWSPTVDGGRWMLVQYNSTFLSASAQTAAPAKAAEVTSPVCSFNIRYGSAGDGSNRWELRRDVLFDLLNRYSYDLVGVQEALHFQIEEILTAVPGYAYIGVGRDDGVEAGEYSAIFYKPSKYRVAESGTFWFCTTPDVPGCTSYGNSIPRISTWGHFVDLTTDTSFYMYNCHLDHQSANSREQSVQQLIKHIRARSLQNTTVLVTGDFNAGERSTPVQSMLSAGFEDTFRTLYPNATNVGTFNGFDGTTTGDKIDYVFASKTTDGMVGVKTLEAAIVRDNEDGRYPSDHFPVSATVQF